MNKILITLVCVLALSGLSAQKLTQSDAVYEKIVKEYTLKNDGSIDFHYYKKLKLLTYFSFNRLYGESFIVYNPDHQTLKINSAFVTQQDGTVVPSPGNAFNEVLPHFAADAPFYNNLREMVVTHSGVELNATINLDYVIHTDAGYWPALMADEILTESSPVLEEVIRIHVPLAKTLNYKVFNNTVVPVVTESSNTREYTFTFQNIKENSHENYQPEEGIHLPGISFSTILMPEAMIYLDSQHALQFKSDESMKSSVRKVKKESKSDLDVLLNLQAMVVNDVNYYPVPFSDAGFTGRTAIETWESNGGTEFEKCILLTALLREAGINAETVGIIPDSLYDKNIGCLPLVRRFLVQANPRELEQIYLSPISTNDQNLIYSLKGNTVLLFNPQKPSITQIDGKYDNKALITANLLLDDSLKLSGSLEMQLFEESNPFYMLKKDSVAVEKLVNGISKESITSTKLVNCTQSRSVVNYKIDSDNALKTEQNYSFYKIPFSSAGSEKWGIHYLNEKRSTPLELPFPVEEMSHITIKVPDSVILLNSSENIERKNDFGYLNISISQNGNEIKITRILLISERTIPVEKYKAFKSMMDLWNENKYRELVLKR